MSDTMSVDAFQAAALFDGLNPREVWLLSVPAVRHRDPALQEQAERFIFSVAGQGLTGWVNLPAGVWRVLMERHLQALVVASANEHAGNSAVMTLPAALPDASIPGAAMIYMLHGMKLPYPVQQRSADEFPLPGAPVSRWLH